MTRKRFVKLLMERGADRNRANVIAEDIREHGFSYAEGYIDMNLMALQYAILRMAGASSLAGEAIQNFASGMASVKEAVEAFSDIYKAAMIQT